ncbi:MAG: hypothetical protein KDE14_13305 [Rhodobacteraceae bacterium]|nr:hypothetical protein [Paracoccaceae bacterium]
MERSLRKLDEKEAGAVSPVLARIRAQRDQIKVQTPAGQAQPAATVIAAAPRITQVSNMHFARMTAPGPVKIEDFVSNEQTFDNPAFTGLALSEAFTARCLPGYTLPEYARTYAQISIAMMAFESLKKTGIAPQSAHDVVAIFTAALHSTSDFPYILADSFAKQVLARYEAQMPSYLAFAAQKTFNDFKSHKFLRLGDFPTLLEVGENGEIQRGTLGESREPVTMATWARIVGINRQVLLNDDARAFADLAASAAQRTRGFENDLVYSINFANGRGPELSNGETLYSAANGNLTTSGTAVNVISNISVGRAAIRNQTSLDGLKLNLRPAILLVGPDNETAAEQITAKTSANRVTAANPLAGSLTPVIDSNITDYAWHLFADPMECPSIIYGSLPGQTGPSITTKPGWDTLGVEIRVVRDFGTGAIDYRGTYRNDGAAPKDEPVAT